MTLSVVASLLLSIIVVWLIVAPFLSPSSGAPSTSIAGGGDVALLDAKERALRAIKDLELDFSMGKLSADDFKVSKEVLSLELLSVLDRIKESGGGEQSA